MISAIYAARNIHYENLQINEKVYLNFFLDKELYPSYFKYLGKEQITTQYGTFNAIKLVYISLIFHSTTTVHIIHKPQYSEPACLVDIHTNILILTTVLLTTQNTTFSVNAVF